MSERAIQDQMEGNGCYGCGPENPHGLQLKSHFRDGVGVARFEPEPHMTAGPPHYLNGGIIATVIDCHAICTAAAEAYEREGRAIGEGEMIWYVTGRLDVQYRKPVPIDQPVDLRATVERASEKKSVVRCELRSGDDVCAHADVTAVRVPTAWLASP